MEPCLLIFACNFIPHLKVMFKSANIHMADFTNETTTVFQFDSLIINIFYNLRFLPRIIIPIPQSSFNDLTNSVLLKRNNNISGDSSFILFVGIHYTYQIPKPNVVELGLVP